MNGQRRRPNKAAVALGYAIGVTACGAIFVIALGFTVKLAVWAWS